MSSQHIFQQVVGYIFQHLGVQAAEGGLSNDAYTVNVDGKLDIHLVGKQEGFLHVWCSPCALPRDVENGLLMELLAVNRISYEYPDLRVSVHRETRDIVLWTRQPLLELNPVGAIALFDRIVAEAEAVQRWLEDAERKEQAPAMSEIR